MRPSPVGSTHIRETDCRWPCPWKEESRSSARLPLCALRSSLRHDAAKSAGDDDATAFGNKTPDLSGELHCFGINQIVGMLNASSDHADRRHHSFPSIRVGLIKVPSLSLSTVSRLAASIQSAATRPSRPRASTQNEGRDHAVMRRHTQIAGLQKTGKETAAKGVAGSCRVDDVDGENRDVRDCVPMRSGRSGSPPGRAFQDEGRYPLRQRINRETRSCGTPGR